MTAVLALAFPAAAVGFFLTEGWSGATAVTHALVPLALLGVAEAVGRKVELYPDRLVVVANLRRTTYARSAFAAASWAKGVPVAREHLDHTRVLNRSFRRLLTVMWPVVSPWLTLLPGGRSRLERPYATEIDNVYQRPVMPKWVRFLWPPKLTLSRRASLAELER